MDTPTVEITKNKREVIRFTREDFRGTDIVNVRVFYPSEEGEMRPGKQGVAFRAALLPDVLEALKALQLEGTS